MGAVASLARAQAQMGRWAGRALGKLPPPMRHTSEVLLFGLAQVPMIAFCLPRVVRLDDTACHIKIPLGWRTKNHFGSMYFGALAVGADVAGGFLVRHHIEQARAPLALIFKSFSARFLRRPEGDVITACEDGLAVRALVAQAAATGERHETMLRLTAHTGGGPSGPQVAEFALEVSVKRRAQRA